MHCKVCNKDIPEDRLKQGKDTCCRSCASKASALLRWQKEEERIKLSNSVKKYFENPDNRKKTSIATKEAMNKEDIKEKHKQAMIDWANRVCTTESYRFNMSKVLKEVYKNQEVRDRVSKSVRAAQTDEYRRKLSLSLKKAYENPELREKLSIRIKEALNNPEIKAKHKFGVQRAFSLHKDEILQKQYETKKKNHSFNSSSTEDKTFGLLKQLFNEDDISHPLKPFEDERYPYECDFYIKSLDLFIECNYHWTHGGRLFDETDEGCIEQLNNWKERAKTSKYYRNAIDTWTKRDAEKMRIAQKNNLSYLVFYSFEEFYEWYTNNTKEE